MKTKNRIVVSLGILILMTIIFFFITSSITKHTGYLITEIKDKSDFEICLEEQQIQLYINTADSTKTIQQIEIKDYLEYIKIINCKTNNQQCIENSINKFPTWMINEYKIEHDVSLSELIKYSGCRFL